MLKQVHTLIISGASITASPWFTWADVLIEILKPRKVINLAARGAGNRWISLSLINAIMQLPSNQCVMCAAMFTGLDKFDMFLPESKTHKYLDQKHPPINLKGQYAKSGPSFWCTGSHWPMEKKLYRDNFFDPVMAAIDTMMIFNSLSQVCQNKKVDLWPFFDSYIWNILEQDLNAFVEGTALPDRNFLADPLTQNFSAMLDNQFLQFVPLINWAIEHDLPYYNDIHKMHPPSKVHLSWIKENIVPALASRYHLDVIGADFERMVDHMSEEWQ